MLSSNINSDETHIIDSNVIYSYTLDPISYEGTRVTMKINPVEGGDYSFYSLDYCADNYSIKIYETPESECTYSKLLGEIDGNLEKTFTLTPGVTYTIVIDTKKNYSSKQKISVCAFRKNIKSGC